MRVRVCVRVVCEGVCVSMRVCVCQYEGEREYEGV